MMNQVRFSRQSAIRIFAQEYSDANLPLEGVGEYAPSFIITKLGAKVNRALFGGVIDRFERREGDNGPTYSGHLRDATGGVHRFQIAPFQPELHTDAEELLARFESGDRFLMMMIGRARWFESDDGGIFTSFRAEEFTTVDRSVYVNWLVETSAATLRRLDAYNSSLESENSSDSLKSAGVPVDLIEGMILAKNHYSSFDPENMPFLDFVDLYLIFFVTVSPYLIIFSQCFVMYRLRPSTPVSYTHLTLPTILRV